ncbi:MAG: nucleotidyltransferase family protein [Sedimentisphaerales bacterium]|nr:nucleotidyltransferase family protein [Sedimentisphaerales bacterium]
MKAILLAAGKAERLKGVLDCLPKPMVQIAGKPILEHNIEWLRSYGVTDVYINLHHLPEVIKRYFSNGIDRGVKITYSYEPALLGTAGAVKKIAHDCWNDNPFEPFIVVYGDNLVSDFNLNRIIQFHKRKKGIATICLYHRPEEVSKSGVAVLDEDHRIIAFVEKPSAGQIAGDLVNTGIYILEANILQYIPAGCCDFGKDVFGRVLDSGESLYGIVLNANLVAIDTPQLYERVVDSGVLK